MSTTTAAAILDGRGKSITTFVIHQANERFGELQTGEILELLTDDFEPFEADVDAWCRARGHRILERKLTTEGQRFLIEKGTPVDGGKRLAMIVSSDGLEELLSPLGFALAAALEGLEVHLFFQGPAVRVLARGFRPKLRGWWRPVTRLAAAQMSREGHLPAHTKLDQLRGLGARLYACGGSMDHFKVSKDELRYDDVPLVEYLTFMSVMAQADIQLYV